MTPFRHRTGPHRVEVDYSLGGVPRLIAVRTDRPRMRIPDEVRKCAVFLAYDSRKFGCRLVCGTGVLVSAGVGPDEGTALYVVTCTHTLDGIEKYSTDGRAYIRINTQSGYVDVETRVHDWEKHSDSAVDASAIKWDGVIGAEVDWVPTDTMAATPEWIERLNLGIGDNVFFVGLFSQHAGRHRNIPVARMGTLAAMREELVSSEDDVLRDLYLVDSRSIGGLSGSPAFIQPHGVRDFNRTANSVHRGAPSEGSYLWLGIVHGHFDEAPRKVADSVAKLNAGISMVVPSDRILELLNSNSFRADRIAMKHEADRSKGRAVADFGDEPKRGPKPDRLKLEGDYADRIKDSFKAKPPAKRKPKKD